MSGDCAHWSDEEFEIYGDGSQSRDFIWVGDVVDAFIKALEDYGIIRLTKSGRAVMEKEEAKFWKLRVASFFKMASFI